MQLYCLENGKILARKHQTSFWMNIRRKLQHDVIACFCALSCFKCLRNRMLYSMYIFPKFHDAGGDDSADDDHGLVVDDR